MKVTPTHIAALAGLSAAAFAAYYISQMGVKGAATAAAKAAADAAAGVVIGVGKSFGIPETDSARCSQAIKAGSWWDESLYCTPLESVRARFGTKAPPVDQTILDPRDAAVRNAGAPYEAPPIDYAAQGLNGADCACGKSWTPEAWIGLAALGATVWIHSQNRRKHRGR